MKPDITDLQLQLAEAQAALYVPGCWLCPTCGFILTKSIMSARSGGISPNLDHVAEACPNDGITMRRQTWQERCKELADVCESQVRRAVEAEKLIPPSLKELKGAVPIVTYFPTQADADEFIQAMVSFNPNLVSRPL